MFKRFMRIVFSCIIPVVLFCACGDNTMTTEPKTEATAGDGTNAPTEAPTQAPTEFAGVEGPSFTEFEVMEFTEDILNDNKWSANWKSYMIYNSDGSVTLGNGIDKYMLACYTDKDAMFDKVISIDMAVEIKTSLSLEFRTRANSGLGGSNNSYYLKFSDNAVDGECHICVQAMKYMEPDYITLTDNVDIEPIVDALGYNNYKIGLINEGTGVRFLLWVNDILVINVLDENPGNLNTAGYMFFQGGYSIAEIRGTDTDVQYKGKSIIPVNHDGGLVTYNISNLGPISTRKLATIMKGYVFTSSDGFKLPYRLYIPTNYTADKKYPLVTQLHGGGLRGDDNLLQLQGDYDNIQMLLDYQSKEEFIFILPQCPIDIFWSGSQTYDTATGHHFDLSQNSNAPQIRALVELMDYLSEEYSVDRTRIYTTGASLGGTAQYDLIYSYPDKFAGAIIGCGRSDPKAADKIKDTPIFLIHGELDASVPVENSRNMYTALQELGADVTYIELAGQPHAFHQDGLLDEAMEWLFSKKRTK